MSKRLSSVWKAVVSKKWAIVVAFVALLVGGFCGAVAHGGPAAPPSGWVTSSAPAGAPLAGTPSPVATIPGTPVSPPRCASENATDQVVSFVVSGTQAGTMGEIEVRLIIPQLQGDTEWACVRLVSDALAVPVTYLRLVVVMCREATPGAVCTETGRVDRHAAATAPIDDHGRVGLGTIPVPVTSCLWVFAQMATSDFGTYVADTEQGSSSGGSIPVATVCPS